jgi:2-keto-4-pentenoate hydratase/2-oxohepta-3-ene-1,7-dioic acid hydratase in catechol pathway
MRLCSYERDGRATVGVVADDRVVPLEELWPDDAGSVPRDMIETIEALHDGSVVLAAPGAGGTPVADLDAAAAWLPPVRRPGKILGVAINNGALAGSARVMPPHPMLFCYPSSALTGHGRPIEIRPDYGLTHPEPELGVVIGRRGKEIPEAVALEHVFGYTIVDDVTSVDLKTGDTTVFDESFAATIGGDPATPGGRPRGFEYGAMVLTYHARSKGTDTFAPCGPWIVTADDIPDPQDLAVTLEIDGERCTEDNTKNLVHSVAAVIAHASRFFTLEAGDILHVGTAAKGRYRLRDLDYQQRTGTRTIEISSIGRLENPIHHVGAGS